jgi:hypothetical protein
MRSALTILLVLALAAPAAAWAARPAKPAPGSLSIEGGRGLVTIKAQGGVLGKVRGAVLITDLTPNDKWRPIVNGVTVRRAVWLRGPEVSFRILGGRFKVQIRGESVSVSARGVGWATLKGEPGPLGETGVYAAGESADCVADPDVCEPVPVEPIKIVLGPLESTDPPPEPTKKSDSRPAAP